MKLISTFGLLLLLLFACKLCSFTGGDTKRFNPYQGSLSDLLPKNATAGGKLELQSLSVATKEDLLRGAENVRNAKEAVQAEYKYSALGAYVIIRVLLVNYETAQGATAAIQDAARTSNATLQPKVKNGQTVGQRYVGSNKLTVIWTDGSLVCQASSTMDHPLKNFEEAMPF